MKKITAKTHKKTILTLLDSMRGYDLQDCEYQILTRQERSEIAEKSITNEIFNLKNLIRQKYLKEFKLYAIELYEKEVAEKKRLAEIEANKKCIRQEEKANLTIEDHYKRLFGEIEWVKSYYDCYTVHDWADFYEVIYGLTKPKIERGFTKEELKKLGFKQRYAKNRIATEQELLKEQIFEFAEILSNEIASKNEIANERDLTKDDHPLHEPFLRYNKKGDFTIRGGCYISNDIDNSYHLNARHTKYIENEVNDAKENYYLFELTDEERKQFANFAEWEASKEWQDPETQKQTQLPFSEKERKNVEYLNDKNQEDWENWLDYRYTWVSNNEASRHTFIHFEITLDGNYVVLTAACGIACLCFAGDTDLVRLAFKVDDVKPILNYNSKPQTIVHELISYNLTVERLADIIYRRVERDKRKPSINKLYKKIYAKI